MTEDDRDWEIAKEDREIDRQEYLKKELLSGTSRIGEDDSTKDHKKYMIHTVITIILLIFFILVVYCIFLFGFYIMMNI